MTKLVDLAKVFANYKIFPCNCFGDGTPVRVFQQMYPNDHYSKEVELFFLQQDYESVRRGADLPYKVQPRFFAFLCKGRHCSITGMGQIAFRRSLRSNGASVLS
jgi:hypothetical protein